MRPKTQNSLNLKLLMLAIFVCFFLLFVLRSSFSSSNQSSVPAISGTSSPSAGDEKTQCSPSPNKIPPTLAHVVIHYATSTITPQQTLKEISVTSEILEKKSPCNFLVFGLGHDSLMWSTLNYGGRTIFLEEDES